MIDASLIESMVLIQASSGALSVGPDGEFIQEGSGVFWGSLLLLSVVIGLAVASSVRAYIGNILSSTAGAVAAAFMFWGLSQAHAAEVALLRDEWNALQPHCEVAMKAFSAGDLDDTNVVLTSPYIKVCGALPEKVGA